MNIVVCVKYVPDAQADRTFNASDNTTDRVGVDGLLSELDEYAVEEALKLVEAGEGEVTVVTVGPDAGCRRDQEGPADGRPQGRPRQGRRDPRLRRHRDVARPRRGGQEDPADARPRHHRHGLDRRHDGRRPGDARRATRPAAGDVRVRADRRRRRHRHDPPRRRRLDADDRRPRCRRSCRSPTRSTSRATPPSRGSWPRRRSRSRSGRSPTSASTPRQVGLDAAWTKVESFAARPPRSRARSSPTRATAAPSSPRSCRAEVHLSADPPASKGDPHHG